MEIQTTKSSVLVRRLRKMLELAFYLIRKGLVSNTKVMIMEMIVTIKDRRGIGRSPSSLGFLSHSKHLKQDHLDVFEYEFSCSNTPVPGYSHKSKKKHLFFPCFTLPKVLEDHVFQLPKDVIFVPNPKSPEYLRIISPDRSHKHSPSQSPFAVRISNYSNIPSDDENDEAYGKVDHHAEEFIKRFYEQLRVQH